MDGDSLHIRNPPPKEEPNAGNTVKVAVAVTDTPTELVTVRVNVVVADTVLTVLPDVATEPTL